MSAAALLNTCVFIPAAGGTADFAVSTNSPGFKTPASAGAVDGETYHYRAVSDDLTQWEEGEGGYTLATTTLPRTTILASSNAGAKVNFTVAPTVAVVAFKEDLVSPTGANSFTATQKEQIQSNIFVKAPTTQTLTSGSGATYTTPSGALWLEVYIVGGGGGGAGAASSGTTVVAGSNGGTSTFNSINAAPGNGAPNTGAGGAGGTGGTGAATLRIPGQPGVLTVFSNTIIAFPAGNGGSTQFGGGGPGAKASGQNAGGSAMANTGAGGGGATNNAGSAANAGGGGGSGEIAYLIINNPAATYTYTVGGSGPGGASSSNGGAGGSGVIFVIEHYS